MVKLPDLLTPSNNAANSSSMLAMQGGTANCFATDDGSFDGGDGDLVKVKDSPSSPILRAKMIQKDRSGLHLSMKRSK